MHNKASKVARLCSSKNRLDVDGLAIERKQTGRPGTLCSPRSQNGNHSNQLGLGLGRQLRGVSPAGADAAERTRLSPHRGISCKKKIDPTQFNSERKPNQTENRGLVD